MVAHGEIGFLFSFIAESLGLCSTKIYEGSSRIFPLVTLTVLLCTVIGRVTVFILVKRVSRPQGDEHGKRTRRQCQFGNLE